MRNYLALLLIAVLFASCSSSGPVDSQQEEDDDLQLIAPVELSPNAKRLMNYLADQYGKKIISGQQDASWTKNRGIDMIARVFEDTGKYPAIKGFDFLELPNDWGDYGRQQLEEAIEWWGGMNQNNGDPVEVLLPDHPEIHGIVTFCWHWRTGEFNEFYTERTSFRIPWKNNKLDTKSAAFKNTVIADLDKIAALLKELKDRDIPVLWRPLHEASGNYQYGQEGWFWWGASGPEPYIALWEYMYYYLANKKGLNNLIWVWNGQHKDWFPNPDTVDIVGTDVYASAKDYGSQKGRFTETLQMVPGKDRMVALTENGQIPDPQACLTDGAMWSWFCTWNDSVGVPGETNEGNFWTGEYNNTTTHRQYVYSHSLVITLDKLPDLTQYRLE
jgi:mannan endo-1,4-beta-mannosidase